MLKNNLRRLVLLTVFLSLASFLVAADNGLTNDGAKLYAEGKSLYERGLKEGHYETVSNAIEYLRKASDAGIDCSYELGRALFTEDLLWSRQTKQLISSNESFLLTYNNRTKTGILLLHDLGTTPAQMRELGEFLYLKGYTVYAPRLAGHGLRPDALNSIGPKEWRKDYLLGYEILKLLCDKIYVIGSGFGGVLSLELAVKENLGGAITLNAPLEFQGVGKYFLFLTQFTGLYQKLRFPEDMQPYSYERLPLKTYNQAYNMAAYVRSRLPEVNEPLAIFQAKQDSQIAAASAERIYDSVKSRDKGIFWLQKASHNLLSSSNPSRQLLFNEIYRFITRTT